MIKDLMACSIKNNVAPVGKIQAASQRLALASPDSMFLLMFCDVLQQ